MTTIVRWNPIREMAAMQSAMDRLFENTWRGVQPNVAGNMLPLDVYENDHAYTVITSLPGLNIDQIQITLHEGTLSISGEVTEPNTENERVLLQERVYGKFSRSVTLPQHIDSEHVEANYENGVLTLTLPKTPNAQPRLIPVKTANGKHNQN
jgi:HSP20 family protein